MNRKDQLIHHYKLEKHIEGGWYKETYASKVAMNQQSIATSIYFLLDEDNFSAFHQLSHDELWFYHEGSPLTIAMIDLEGKFHEVQLGLDLQHHQVPYYCVPSGWIFASYVAKDYCFVSCVVSPGFTYDDFRLYKRNELIEIYPQHRTIIQMLTR